MYKIFEKMTAFAPSFHLGKMFFFFPKKQRWANPRALTINLRTSVFSFDMFFFAANQFTKSE